MSEAALAGPPPPKKPQPSDLLLQGLAARATEGYAAGAPVLKEALAAFQHEGDLSPNDARWLWFASLIALFMSDDQAWTVLFTRQVDVARQTGALSALPFVLGTGTAVYAFFGELGTAALLEEELRAATQATGIAADPAASLSLAALRGHEAEFLEVIRTTIGEAEARGEGIALTIAEFLSGGLYNGLGRYEAALAAVLPAERFYTEGPAIWALTELIEAAVRCGQPDRARRAFERVQETTSAAGTDWALGIEARLRALLSDGDDADELYTEAISKLGRTNIRVQLARTHLLYGEWLRRQRRRLDAREQLRTLTSLQRRGSGGVRRASATRAGGDRRACPQADRGHARPAHPAGDSDRSPRRARGDEPRDRRSTIHQRKHGRVPPGKAFRKLDVKSRVQLEDRLS